MVDRIETPSVTVPAGTPLAAPVDFPLDWQRGDVQRVEIFVPPGPSGLVGFAIGHSGVIIIPWRTGQWIVTDNERIQWDLDGYPTGARWFVRAYNTDIYPHSIYYRFLLKELGQAPTPAMVPIVVESESVAQPDAPAVGDIVDQLVTALPVSFTTPQRGQL